MDQTEHSPTTDATARVPTCAEALRGLAVLLARAEARRLAGTVPANATRPPQRKDPTT
jgi:hypothetical protein